MKKKLLFFCFILLIGISIGATRYKPTVTTSKCAGCNECVVACPVTAITMVGTKAVIDPEICIGCLICTKICSWGAVE